MSKTGTASDMNGFRQGGAAQDSKVSLLTLRLNDGVFAKCEIVDFI